MSMSTETHKRGLTRRSFLGRASAVVAGAVAFVTGMPRDALGATQCFAPSQWATCSLCHGICSNFCKPRGKMSWSVWRNNSGTLQCCTAHGWNGCAGAYSCSGGVKWWMGYVTTNPCCGCASL